MDRQSIRIAIASDEDIAGDIASFVTGITGCFATVSIAYSWVGIISVVEEVGKLDLKLCSLCRFLALKALVEEMHLLEAIMEVGL